jgi:hypothetical protein
LTLLSWQKVSLASASEKEDEVVTDLDDYNENKPYKTTPAIYLHGWSYSAKAK